MAKAVKILAASDLHGVIDLQMLDAGADVVVLAGDIAPLSSLTLEGIALQGYWVQNIFTNFISQHPGIEFVFIGGNHDFWATSMYPDETIFPRNAHYLENSECTVKGLRFYGMPQIPTINGRWAFESGPSVMAAACELIPDGIDVLVTHTPPMVEGCNIDASVEMSDDGDGGGAMISSVSEHFGSRELTDAILRTQPLYHFCGHIHTGSHACVDIGRTQSFNVSLLDENYRLGYTPLVVDIEVKGRKRK